MTDRRHPSTPCLSMQLDILFALGMARCAICGEVIHSRKDVEWDHFIEWADGGEHTVDNLRPVHNKATEGCHKRKSAKAERDRHHIERLAAARMAAMPKAASCTDEIPAEHTKAKPRSVWPKGRKLQGRGFQQTHRPMNQKQREDSYVKE